ncbi:MAG: superoxide dismutase [Vicinamibacterales bacterium]
MSLTRRQVLLRSAATLALPLYATLESQPLAAQAPAAPTGPFTLPALPYAADALEPHIDAQTMTIHHDRHHATYVTNLNTALANYNDLKSRNVEDLVRSIDTLPEAVRTAVRNQGGGHLNHTWFWTSLKKGGSPVPSAEFGTALNGTFGDFAKFKESLAVAATGVFGSGWAWLSIDRTGKLVIETTPNQDNPLTRGNRPLLGIDVWEHAYYLKYQNRRRDYVDAIFNVVDWNVVQERWRAARG